MTDQQHVTFEWVAGDDWQINATLNDENGNPLNLAGALIKWALLDSSYKRVLDQDDISVSVTDAAAGKCSINIPAAKTTTLGAGRYSDAIRVVIGGITSTLAFGMVYVMADPWLVATATARIMPTVRRQSVELKLIGAM